MTENELYNQLEEYDKEIIKLAKENKKLKSRITKALDLIKELKLLPTCEYDIEEQLDNLENRLKGEENDNTI